MNEMPECPRWRVFWPPHDASLAERGTAVKGIIPRPLASENHFRYPPGRPSLDRSQKEASLLTGRYRQPHVRSWVVALAAGVVTSALLLGCTRATGSGAGKLEVVGSFYPLAWAAEQVGGPQVHVLDLTPPGVEAHDTNLSARQVGQIDNANVVLILGYLGFQPQVEQAARQASGRVVQVAGGIHLRPSVERGLSADPHVWLDPVLMEQITLTISRALVAADPSGKGGYEARAARVTAQLSALDSSYPSRTCRANTPASMIWDSSTSLAASSSGVRAISSRYMPTRSRSRPTRNRGMPNSRQPRSWLRRFRTV